MAKNKKLRRLQGTDWHKVKNSMKLLSVTESHHGNLCGIYTDGKKEYVHWLNDEEKEAYKKQVS